MIWFVSAISWLQGHYIELAGVLTGLLYVFYTIEKNNLLWFYGIISSALYIIIFYRQGFYANMVLYFYYVIISVYGWYNWKRNITSGSDSEETQIPMVHLGLKKLYFALAVTLAGTIAIYYGLRQFQSSGDVVLMDCLLTASSMVATWMLTQKIIEHWLFWVVIDLLYTIVMLYEGLYPSALLFFAYTLLAVKGYIEWKKELQPA